MCIRDSAGDVTGKDAERALEEVGITANKNTIPGEKRAPFVTSGIRVGSAAATTRGFTEPECERVGQLIGDVVNLSLIHISCREGPRRTYL